MVKINEKSLWNKVLFYKQKSGYNNHTNNRSLWENIVNISLGFVETQFHSVYTLPNIKIKYLAKTLVSKDIFCQDPWREHTH